MKCLKTDLFKKSSLDAGGKTGGPGENLWKQVWTGNQMHIRRRDWESNPGPFVHSAGEEPLRYLLPHLMIVFNYDSIIRPKDQIARYSNTGIGNIITSY